MITGLSSTYKTNDTITINWSTGSNTTHCNYWLYYQNGGEWTYYKKINYASSPVNETLGAGKYRAHVVAYNSNYWEADNSDWLHTFSDYVYFTVNTPTANVSVRLNGGAWPSGVSDPSGQYELGSRITLPTPVRTGYDFVGWNLALSGSGHVLEPWGTPRHADPTFTQSMGNVNPYNNNENGTVTVERIAKTDDCPTSSAYMLKVKTAGSASPWNGGFYQLTNSKASGVFYHVIVAKIPVGYQIDWKSNAIGEGTVVTWLTPTEGTGKFETYIYKVSCGATGNFRTFGHVCLIGKQGTEAEPLIWYVGYSEVFDGTGVSVTGNTYTVGNGGGTLSAMWREKDHNVDIQLNGGEWPSGYNDPSGEYKHGSKISLATPVRDGYDFAGWALTYEGDDHALEPWGVPLKAYPDYGNSMDNARVYNNLQNGNVTVEIVDKTNDCPTSSPNMLKVKTAGSASPYNGGFCQWTLSKASGVFYHVIVAKIPVGNQIEAFSNAIGDGAVTTWLTPQDGTGQFETYIYKVECGATGTFSSFGYVALKGRQGTESNPLEWYVGYSEVFEGAGVEAYNNFLNGTVTVGRVAKTSDCPTSSPYMLEVKTAGSASPHNGGFCQPTGSKASGVFYHVIVAKIPVGNQIETFSNAIGDNAAITWLTPQDGTGRFETYIYKVECGATGTFSSFGFVSLKGRIGTQNDPLVWYVGYSAVFDGTRVSPTGNTYTVGSGNSILSAMWLEREDDSYTVVFNSNQGDGTMEDQAIPYDAYENLTANAFSRTGYSFIGWNTEADGSGTAYSDGASVCNLTSGTEITLYAQWKAKTYIVRYYANGGEGAALENQRATYDVPFALQENSFTRTGYTAAGWNTAADGSGTAYENGQLTSNLTDAAAITLYAQFAPNTYAIVFNANGGEGEMADQQMTYGSYSALTQNAFARTGYTFDGWNTAKDGTGTAYPDKRTVRNLATEGTVTLYAQWTRNTFTILFAANGGTGTATSQKATYNLPIALTANAFTRTGYTFNGWNTESDGSGTQFTDRQTVLNLASTGTVKLYAQWKPKTYTIMFVTNGGTGSTVSQKTSYDLPTELTLNTFTRTGYSFYRWNTAADGTGSYYTDGQTVKNLAVSGTFKLYAQWKPNKYTVTFDANGGSGTMVDQSMTYNTSAALRANTYTQTGYTFTGWNTTADGSGTAYANGKTVRNLATEGTVTLYAQWKANTITVRFYPGGGTGSMSNQVMTYDVPAALSANAFYRDGYTFAGWKTGSGVIYTDGQVVENLALKGVVNLYAQWTR